ncbi:hypothetical protein EIP86_009420 [Pleurotus ostreatoroseus]|nr:hypothetical protein EIP86_009420 [Pleurotus ostreatoroseus]
MAKTLSASFTGLLGLLTLVPLVSAHGYLRSVAIDGQVYQGNVPNNYAFDSPIRLIDDVGPVKGDSNPNLACGQDAQAATLVASANPGSALSFAWAGGDGGVWPHFMGPLLTYMASCTGTTCDKFDPSQAQWFKIDQAGQKPGSSDYFADDLHVGLPYNMTLPQNIAPGDYLIRHEILALHLGNEPDGAEFYPSCTQVRIGGSGTDTPNSTVTFPGAYDLSDPGILVPDIYNPGFVYTDFPGPPISNVVADSSSGAAVNAASPASSAAAESPSATDDSGDYDGNCSNMKRKRMVKRHNQARLSKAH